MSKIRWFTDQANVEPDAVKQIERTASMPFVTDVAVMPDVHLGKGSTIGTVVATKGAIMPACVGVDIGCGMIAVQTSLKPEQVIPHAETIRKGIERRIPVGIGPYGMNSSLSPASAERVAELEASSLQQWGDVNHMNARATDWRRQLGSLGGGNHFIEICEGKMLLPHFEDGDEYMPDEVPSGVWVILHSGSRGIGNKTATHWTNVAKAQAKRYMYDSFLPDPDLAYLIEKSEEYWQYMHELYWCQKFAHLNREEMMDRVLTELAYTVFKNDPPAVIIEQERINCHHNYVSKEQGLTITRKGAIFAGSGARALIPGSMGARSYIVTGLGNAGSFNSAPHGAGRKMSRTAARKLFTVDSVKAEMDAQGIEARIREQIVDEAPGAYKDIDVVMREARDLVQPTHVLRQLISVKGD